MPDRYFRELLLNRTVCCLLLKGKAKYHTCSLSENKRTNFCFNHELNASSYFVRKEDLIRREEQALGNTCFLHITCVENNSDLFFSLLKNKQSKNLWFCNCYSVIPEKNLARPCGG